MNDSKNTKILVTGAGGFIGHHLCNYLAKQGAAVIGIDIKSPDDKAEPRPVRFRFEEIDFRDRSKVAPLLRQIDVVFHLASAHLQINLPEEVYTDVNVRGVAFLLSLARECGVRRFIHVSTVGVYGNLQQWPADENSPCNPQSIYGETKLAGENEVRKFADATHFPAVIVRPTWVFGPGCPRTLKIYRALRKKRFFMIGDGGNLRHPIFIEDMLKAFELMIQWEDLVGTETFIVGGPAAITTQELVDTFVAEFELPKPKIRLPKPIGKCLAKFSETPFKLVGKEPPFSTRSLEFFESNNAFNIRRAVNRLNFSPHFSFAEGLRRSRQWLESN